MPTIKDIPDEGERVDLSKLPQTNILIAVEQKYAEAKPNKSPGLIITYQQKDGAKFPQKYGAAAGHDLVVAMKKLGYDNTDELEKNYHEYVLTPQRSGYPRYIPTKKVK